MLGWTLVVAALWGADVEGQGKVLLLASADLGRNDFLVQGGDFSSALVLLQNAVEVFCLDARLARVKEEEGRQEKLSPALGEIAARLPSPVVLRYYSGGKVPPEAARLKGEALGLLRALAGASKGRLSVEEVSPDGKKVEFLAELRARGIAPLEGGYFAALEVRAPGKSPEVIPAHRRMAGLQAELARRLLKLAAPAPPLIAFFDGAGRREEGGGLRLRPPAAEHSGLLQALQPLGEVKETSLRDEAEWDELTEASRAGRGACLIVARPDGLEDRQVYGVARAVSRGVSALFLVSGHSLDVSVEKGYPLTSLQSGLETVFSAWGVALGADLLASRDCAQLPVPQKLEKVEVRLPKPLPVLPRATGTSLQAAHPLLHGVRSLVFPAAAPLRLDVEALRRAGLKATVLADSGKESYAVRMQRLRIEKGAREEPRAALKLKELSDPKERKDGFLPPQPLAVLLEGSFPLRMREPPPQQKKKDAR